MDINIEQPSLASVLSAVVQSCKHALDGYNRAYAQVADLDYGKPALGRAVNLMHLAGHLFKEALRLQAVVPTGHTTSPVNSVPLCAVNDLLTDAERLSGYAPSSLAFWTAMNAVRKALLDLRAAEEVSCG